MSGTASFPATMRGWAIRAYGEKMVLMDDLPVPRPGPHDDKALNCVSGKAANDYVAARKDGGKMVDLPGAVSVQRAGVDIVSDYVVRGNGARLAEVTRLLDTGALRLVVQEIVPFDEAQRALDLALADHVRGKVVLKVG
jgi:NADPH:quinone reductase-like Zn-dependent oxidoreductase